MNYADANIFVYALLDTTERGQKSREFLKGKTVLTSILSLDEVTFKVKKKSLEHALAAVHLLAHSPNVKLVPFLLEDADRFQEFLKAGFQPRDAIHALSAVKSGCTAIYSEDRDFDKLEIPRKTPW